MVKIDQQPTAREIGEREAILGGRMLDRAGLAKDVRELSAIDSWESVKAIATQWLIIGLAITTAVLVNHWGAYLVAMVIVGTRQNALGVLMHDAGHFRLFKNRLVNDTVSDLFCAFPLWSSTLQWRVRHGAHHNYTLTEEKDPDYRDSRKYVWDWRKWPKTPLELGSLAARDLTGLSFPFAFMVVCFQLSPFAGYINPRLDEPHRIGKREAALFFSFVATLFTALTLTGGWTTYLVLWIVPQYTVLWACFRFKGFAEHECVENTNELNAARTIIPTSLERFLISPMNVGYHLEHHLFPSVPFYNLQKLHHRLMREDVFRENAHITRTYFGLREGLLYELMTNPATPVQSLETKDVDSPASAEENSASVTKAETREPVATS